MPPPLTLHPEVQDALQAGRPVVALESTLITHGFPQPENVEVAIGLEDAVREQGAGAGQAGEAVQAGDGVVGQVQRVELVLWRRVLGEGGWVGGARSDGASER